MTNQFFHLTKVSGNAKTGPIAVTTSSKNTCPARCPLNNANEGGCYAQAGPISWHWNAVSTGKRGTDWNQHLRELNALPKFSALRINQAGDLPLFGGSIGTAVRDLDKVVPRHSWTYTHHDPETDVILGTKRLTVNVSCEDFRQVDWNKSLGLPVVVVLPENAPKVQYTPKGHKVVVCPAQTLDNVTCASCMLCAKKDRKIVIGFRAHGTSKKKAETALKMVGALNA
jgi:hypothetical protein